jgi:DNA polymerase/3'-5' exonuclease PolX
MNREEARKLISRIRNIVLPKHGKDITVAGSYRRGKRSIRDLDFVVVNGNISSIVSACQKKFKPCRVVRAGEKLATLLISRQKIQIEFYTTTPECYGAAMLHSTGSAQFNESLRALAKRKGFKLNQYGLFQNEKSSGFMSEAMILAKLGFKWIPPEERNGPVGMPDLKSGEPKGINAKVAKVLEMIAARYLKKKDMWRAHSFDRAAAVVSKYPKPINRVPGLIGISYIGPSIAEEIRNILKTGTSPRLAA